MVKRTAIPPQLWAILIFGVAFLVRLVYLVQIEPNPNFYQPFVDELWNVTWAKDIIQNSFWGTGAYFRGPLYPYFLALVLTLTGSDFFWTRVVQMAISSGSVVLTYFLAREYFSESVARVASLFMIIYATFLFYDAMFLIPVLFVFLNLLGLLLLSRARRSPGRKNLLLVGIVFGLSAIARPNILLVCAVLVFWIFFYFFKRLSVRKAIILAAAFIIGVAAPILPVTVRNLIVNHDFVLISSQGGINLYLGNNPVAEGLTMMMPEIRLDAGVSWDEFNPAVTEYAEKMTGRTLKQSEVSAFWTNKAKEYIFQHPGKFIALTFKKFVYLLSGFENSDQIDIYYYRTYSPLLSILLFDKGLKFPFGFFAPLALVGIGLSWRRRRELAPLLLFLAAYIPTIILFLVTARHRLTLIPVLLLFAAYCVMYIFERLSRGNLKKAGIIVGVFVVLAVVLNQNYFDLGFKNPAHTHYSLGLSQYRQGNYFQAYQEYEKAISEAPEVAQFYYGSGISLYQLGRLDDARRRLDRAIELEPFYSKAYNGLGLVMEATGDTTRARRNYLKAIQYDSTDVEAYINLGDFYQSQDNLSDAEQAYLGGLKVAPDNHLLLTKLGVLYSRVGLYDDAIQNFREAQRVDPTYAPGYLNWGNTLLKAGDTTAAIDKYAQALQYDPQLVEAYYNLAILYARQGDRENALSEIEKLLQVRPGYEPALKLQKSLRR